MLSTLAAVVGSDLTLSPKNRILVINSAPFVVATVLQMLLFSIPSESANGWSIESWANESQPRGAAASKRIPKLNTADVDR